MDLDAVLLSRFQFAFLIAFHIIFPSFTIGLAAWLATIEGVRLATGNSIYRRVFDFWLKVFALSFGMGVVTGIVMAFQFGTNWSVLAERSGPIMGPLLGYEAFTAFILEATFFGVMLLGRDRVSPGVYFFACCMVSLGTMFSSFWILANNSWMRMQLNKRRNLMDTSVVIDSNPAPCLPINPSLGSSTRGAATARIAGVVAASVLVLLVAFSGHVGHARDRLSGEVQRIKMIGFTVADVDREANFFAKVLQFEKISDFRVLGSEYDKMQGVFNVNMRIVHLKLGEQIVELTQYVSPPTGRPIPVPSYSNDAWFEHMAIVVNDMDAAYKILQENNVQQISANAITIPESNPGAAGIRAIKFRDPEGHDLELIYFPPGKGDPSWQKPAADKLFLGLSHTAMTVASTDKGVTFYRDLLGLDVGGVTFNSGATQDVLDDLFNDTCLVTEMVPVSAPPHIEFLDYKTPPGGRLMPVDTRANDLWHWQTTLVTKDIQAVTDRLRNAGAQFITPDVVIIPQEAQAQLGFKKALMVRDPNGHAIRLIEE